jgi:CBS domain-containing protein
MKASEILTQNITTIGTSATVVEAVSAMKATGVGALIVNRRHSGDAYGIVTRSDIVSKVVAFGRDPHRVRVYQIMTKPCIVVNPDLSVEYVARLFVHTGIQVAPVIQGELLGTISMRDILEKSDFIETPSELELDRQIQEAIAHARTICAEVGHPPRECAAAWQVVEELQADAAHQQATILEKTAFEEYCEEYPEAAELANLYKNWCSG